MLQVGALSNLGMAPTRIPRVKSSPELGCSNYARHPHRVNFAPDSAVLRDVRFTRAIPLMSADFGEFWGDFGQFRAMLAISDELSINFERYCGDVEPISGDVGRRAA